MGFSGGGTKAASPTRTIATELGSGTPLTLAVLMDPDTVNDPKLSPVLISDTRNCSMVPLGMAVLNPRLEKLTAATVKDDGGVRLPSPSAALVEYTCTNPNVKDGVLFASCKANNGEAVNTWLHKYASCRSDINNNDGLLRCNNGLSAPGGTYTQTCTNIFNNSGELSAQCKTKGGQLKRTLLANFADCKGKIGNDDGNLKCYL